MAQIFFSYKSQDAAAVRMIAEQMRAQGISVWFAEYNIDVKHRGDFQSLIDAAIADCEYGICFTNDHYADSRYCLDEMKQLLDRLPVNKVLQIAFPGDERFHQLFPQLAEAPLLEVPVSHNDESSRALSLQDANRILNFISKETGIRLSPCMHDGPAYGERIYARCRGIRYSIDAAGWSIKSPGLIERILNWRSLGPKYERQSPDGNAMWGYILSGKQDRGVRRWKLPLGKDDDRKYYEEALKFANAFYENQRQHCAGVHLLFVDGVSHPAFTTIRRDSGIAIMMGRQVWMRLYSVVLRSRWRWCRDKEFAFFFFVRGNLDAFLRCAYLMDRLVLSFRREDRRTAKVRNPSNNASVDKQTAEICRFLNLHHAEYVRQIKWWSNPIGRILDAVLLGIPGFILMSLGRGRESVLLLDHAVKMSCFRKIRGQALYHRACILCITSRAARSAGAHVFIRVNAWLRASGFAAV